MYQKTQSCGFLTDTSGTTTHISLVLETFWVVTETAMNIHSK